VTGTQTVNESLNDVAVLPNGAIRVVWAANLDTSAEHDVYARAFTLPLTIPFTATVQQPINVDGSCVFRASRGVIPVKFTLAVGSGREVRPRQAVTHRRRRSHPRRRAGGSRDACD